MVREVRTERLCLRPLVPPDREEYLRVQEASEGHFRPWFPEQVLSFEEMFDEELSKNGEPDRHVRMGAESGDGRLVGFFNLSNIVRGVFQNAYASWSVAADVLREGFGFEGVSGLLDLAFSADRGLGLHRVQANIIPRNEPSIRLAERVGMRREGRAERYLKIDGRWQEHLMYAKTVEEHQFRYLT